MFYSVAVRFLPVYSHFYQWPLLSVNAKVSQTAQLGDMSIAVSDESQVMQSARSGTCFFQ